MLMSYYEEILNNKTMQVVWYAAERKKEKKKVGKQLPVTYMSSSQFSQHFLSVAPKYNHMYGKKKEKKSHLSARLHPTHKSKFTVKL